MKVRKRGRDREKKKEDFNQVKQYTRMTRMSNERFLEAQDFSEFKDGKEKLNE